jgi:dynein heavy chain
LTDTQIIDEKFLISINDILSSGYVPELFNDEEKDEIRGKVRSEAKSLGIPDMPDDQWNFFLDKVTKNLHICLCFSPVSEKFRIRARKFPALINSTKIDWFHEWPEDALIGVANRFLATIDLPSDELRDSIAKNMANVHLSIGAANIEFKQKERRFNYTTPTSYLELISFYKLLLGKKQGNLDVLINRLENGLGIMINTLQQVDELKKFLDAKMINVAYEKKKTQELIEVVERETEIANEEEEKAT